MAKSIKNAGTPSADGEAQQPVKFPNNLKKILVKEGIRQTELAREAGLSAGAINRYCSGTNKPSDGSKSRILKAINRLAKARNPDSFEPYKVDDIFPKT